MATSPDASTIGGVPLTKGVVMAIALLSFLLALLLSYFCRDRLMSCSFGRPTRSDPNRDLDANSDRPSSSNPVPPQLPTWVGDRQFQVPTNSYVLPSSFGAATVPGHVAVTTALLGFPNSTPAAPTPLSRDSSVPVEALQAPTVQSPVQSALAPPEQNPNTISYTDLVALARRLQILYPAAADPHQQGPTIPSSQAAFVPRLVPQEQSPTVSPPTQGAVAPSEQNMNRYSYTDLMALARALKMLYPAAADLHQQNPSLTSAQATFPPQDPTPTVPPPAFFSPQRYSALPPTEATKVPQQEIPLVLPQKNPATSLTAEGQQNPNTWSHTNLISLSQRLQDLFPAAIRSRQKQNQVVPPLAKASVLTLQENPILQPAAPQTEPNPSMVSHMSRSALTPEPPRQDTVPPPAPAALVPYQYWTVPPLVQGPAVRQQQHPTVSFPAQAPVVPQQRYPTVQFSAQAPVAPQQQYLTVPSPSPAQAQVVPQQQYPTVPSPAQVVPQQQHPTVPSPAQAQVVPQQQHPLMSQQMEVVLADGLAQVVESIFN